MQDKIKTVEYNLGMLKLRIEKLKLPDKLNYEIINTINKMNEKLYEISDLLESIESINEDDYSYTKDNENIESNK